MARHPDQSLTALRKDLILLRRMCRRMRELAVADCTSWTAIERVEILHSYRVLIDHYRAEILARPKETA